MYVAFLGILEVKYLSIVDRCLYTYKTYSKIPIFYPAMNPDLEISIAT